MAKTTEQIEAQKDKTDHPKQSEEHDQIVKDLQMKFLDSKNAKKDIEADLQEALDEYENILNASTDGLANIKNPILFAIVANKLAEEITNAPDVRFLPKKEEDVDRVANVKAAYVDSTTRGRFSLNILKSFMSKDVVGTGIGCEEYSMKKRTVRDLVMDKKGNFKRDKSGNLVTNERVIYDEDDLVMRNVDVRRFFPQPSASDMETCNWCFELEEVDFDEFLMYATHDDIYIKNNLDLVRAEVRFDYGHPFGVPFKNNEEKQKAVMHSTGKPNKVLLIKYWNKIQDRYIVIANGILVRDTPNPYAHKQLPYVRFVNHMEMASFWGRSEYRVIKQTIEEKNNFRNVMTDWAKISINRPILLGHTDFEDEDIQFGPGAIWEVGDINQVKLLDLGDIPNGIFGMENKMEEDLVAFTGIDIKALIGAGDETATKSAIKQEKALKRVGLGLKVVDWVTIEPFAKMRLSNIQQFYTEKRAEMVMDRKGELKEVNKFRDIRVPEKTVIRDSDGNIRFVDNRGGFGFFESKPEYISMQVDVVAVTGSSLSISKEVDRQNFNQTLQTIAAFPELRALMNWRNVGEEIATKSYMKPADFLISETPNQEGQDAANTDLPAEQLLAEQGVPRPGRGAGGKPGSNGDIPNDLPTPELLEQLFNSPPNANPAAIPGGPQPAAQE